MNEKQGKWNTSSMEQPQIVMKNTDDLIPYARNARTHPEAQVAQIAASIVEFGFTAPVLVHGNGILAGHGRLLAARKLGQATVPCLDLSHLTKTQAQAYILADNQLALNAGWDGEMLALELADLKDEGFDMSLLGFDNIDALLAEPGESMDPAAATKTLAERFGVPPFSVMNAREGWWQDRKRAWLGLGIKSEVGRGGGTGTPPPPADGDPEPGWNAELRRDCGPGGAVRQAAPGGSARPAMDYSQRQRGDGKGRPMK